MKEKFFRSLVGRDISIICFNRRICFSGIINKIKLTSGNKTYVSFLVLNPEVHSFNNEKIEGPKTYLIKTELGRNSTVISSNLEFYCILSLKREQKIQIKFKEATL